MLLSLVVRIFSLNIELAQAQVQSSDALKNVPFLLSGTNSQGECILFQGRNSAIVSVQVAPNASPSHPQHLVHIDKSVLNSIAIGIFSFSEEVHHMPLVSTGLFFLCSLLWLFDVHLTFSFVLVGGTQNFCSWKCVSSGGSSSIQAD
jgi:hypothetical protein